MASRGVNKVILVGNLGGDPETRYMPSGGAVTNITVATSETWKDKNTGQQQERTEWHRVVFFNRLAEIAGEYLRKGSKVYLEGALRTRKWQDKTSGQDRYTTEIVAAEMQMLDSRGEGGYQQNQGQGGGYPQQNQGGGFQQDQGGYQDEYSQGRSAPSPMAPANQPGGQPQNKPAGKQPPAGGFDNSFDDDIPF